MTTEITIFDKPQENMRGIAHEMVQINGKDKRIAHAYLETGEVKITLAVPSKKVSAKDAREIANRILAFVDACEAA